LPPPHPPTSTLFPYTTLFRSDSLAREAEGRADELLRIAEARAAEAREAERRLASVQSIKRTSTPSDESPVALHVAAGNGDANDRSEEHTSELQSRGHLVCRLL